MPHSPEDKKRAVTRVKRVRGQLDALQTALEAGTECGPILQQLAAIRGAVNGLMANILESHLREEFSQASALPGGTDQSINDVVTLVRSYLR